MTEYTIGIDLGTTNSCVAIFRNDQLEIIENEQGHRVTPSWVTFTEDVILTGNEAVDESHKYLKTTVYDAKRLIGQKFSDPRVQKDIKRLPYEIINDLGSVKIKIDHGKGNTKTFYPEEISAFILGKMRSVAEARLNTIITRCVVTVPAYFNDAQRQATKDAARIAKFKIINVINEPTAAALAFNHRHKKDFKRNVIVYDFGGGTFDVSVVSVGRGMCEVKATEGDSHLGGIDVDMNLVKYIKEEFKKKFGKDIKDDDVTRRRLKNKCENAKKKLSGSAFQIDIELDSFSDEDFTSFTLSRTRLELLNQELFEKTIKILDQCLSASKFTKEQIDEVVLVGGSSRIPKIQEMLKDYFGSEKVNKGVNPDEAVAYGAAIHASVLAGDKSEVQVLDVTSLSLGTNVFGDQMNVIIPRNTPLPAKALKRYQTVMDNQNMMGFPIYQGEDVTASENFELGYFSMNDLTPAPAGKVVVEIFFQMNNEGLLKVTATERKANSNKKDILIDVKKKGLSEEQIQQRILEAERNKEIQTKRRKFMENKYNLEIMLHKVKLNSEKFEEKEKNKILDEHDKIYKWFEKARINNLNEFPEMEKTLKQLLKKKP